MLVLVLAALVLAALVLAWLLAGEGGMVADSEATLSGDGEAEWVSTMMSMSLWGRAELTRRITVKLSLFCDGFDAFDLRSRLSVYCRTPTCVAQAPAMNWPHHTSTSVGGGKAGVATVITRGCARGLALICTEMSRECAVVSKEETEKCSVRNLDVVSSSVDDVAEPELD